MRSRRASATSTRRFGTERGERQEREARHPIAEARAHRFAIDWTGPAQCARRGRRSSAPGRSRPTRSTTSSERIDWTPFFATWELRGAYPAILDDPSVGPAARDLHRDAMAMLERIVDERLLTREGGVRVLAGEQRRRRHRALRVGRALGGRSPSSTRSASRWSKPPGRPNLALADFTAPRETGVEDYVGAFAVTAGHGVDELVARVRGRPRRLLRRSSPRRSRTAWPRRSRSGSTSWSGATLGLLAPRAAAERRDHPRGVPGHPAGARLPGLPRPHREGHAVRAAGRGGRGRHPAHRVVRDVARAPRSAATTSGTREAHYFGLGRIGPRPARRLRRAQGHRRRDDGPLAGAEPGRRLARRIERPPQRCRSWHQRTGEGEDARSGAAEGQAATASWFIASIITVDRIVYASTQAFRHSVVNASPRPTASVSSRACPTVPNISGVTP